MENSNLQINNILNLIKCPLVTEKAIKLNENKQYAFIVDKSLKKPQIKQALESMFNVSIASVKTSLLPPKTRRIGKTYGRRRSYKKAYIKLKEGYSIETLFN
jgi:large subunit ribosomal protein L23